MLTLLVWCNEGINPSFSQWLGSLFVWMGVLCIRKEDASLSILLTWRGTYPLHPPFWSCKLWPSSMSSCVSHGVHNPMTSMGSDVIPSAKHVHSFQCLQPLHITWSLHPSSVDAPVDVHGRSYNFPLIHPREVLLAGHWMTAAPLLSCGLVCGRAGTSFPCMTDTSTQGKVNLWCKEKKLVSVEDVWPSALVHHFIGGDVCHDLMYHLTCFLFAPIPNLPLSLKGISFH